MHHLAKYGAYLLARFVFTTDRNFLLEGKLSVGKISPQTLQAQLELLQNLQRVCDQIV